MKGHPPLNITLSNQVKESIVPHFPIGGLPRVREPWNLAALLVMLLHVAMAFFLSRFFPPVPSPSSDRGPLAVRLVADPVSPSLKAGYFSTASKEETTSRHPRQETPEKIRQKASSPALKRKIAPAQEKAERSMMQARQGEIPAGTVSPAAKGDIPASATGDAVEKAVPAEASSKRPEGLGGGMSDRASPDGSRVAAGEFAESEVADRPVPVERAEPLYPASARRRNVEGSVRLKFMVDETGGVRDVSVLASTPSGVFERSAIEGVSAWRFRPGRSGGVPVRVWCETTVRFRLE